MKVFRISRKQYATDLTGEGAKLYGGRWNSAGKSMLYTASHRSLAVLELLVHLPKNLLPKDMVLITINVDIKNIASLDKLPKNWREMPVPRSTQRSGDLWLVENKLSVGVPSTIIPQESNVLLNPQCSLFSSKVEIEEVQSFSFDQRLFV